MQGSLSEGRMGKCCPTLGIHSSLGFLQCGGQLYMNNNADVYSFDLIFDLKMCVRYTDMELKDRWTVARISEAFSPLPSLFLPFLTIGCLFFILTGGTSHVCECLCEHYHTAAWLCASLFLFLLPVLPRGPLHSHVIFHGMEFSKMNPTGFLLAGIM